MTTNQARLDLPCPILAADPLGFEIGFDHARLGITPSGACAGVDDAITQGWQAGRAVFGQRSAGTTWAQRCWLELRTEAWRAGRPMARLAVTPQDLQAIDRGSCPVTGQPFEADPMDRAVAACLSPDQAPAMGRLVLLSRAAATALPPLLALSSQSLLRRVREVEAGREPAPCGLDACALRRLATLVSLVHSMSHAEAAAWPLCVVPAPRLQLVNPLQRLQWLVSRQFASPGWSLRLRRWSALVADASLRNDFQLFIGAFAPRVIEGAERGRDTDAMLAAAWFDPRVQRRWQNFAAQLGDAGTRALLEGAMARGLLQAQQGPARDSRSQRARGAEMEGANRQADRLARLTGLVPPALALAA